MVRLNFIPLLKNIAKNLVLNVLNSLARKRIPDQTEIIGITGSVGKTTAKEAVAKILQTKFQVLANKKSFNSEFGVPLTLLEENSGFSSPSAWLGIIMRAVKKSSTRIPADKIILELGVDAPGDMQKLLQIVKPSIGVVLAIKPVHLATGQFESTEAIAKEKSLLPKLLPANGTAILNADDSLVANMQTSAKKITFGIKNSADVQASDINESINGINAKIDWQEESVSLFVPILGKHNLTPILAAITIGLACGINLKDCVSALAEFHLPPGRLNLLKGINGSKIIDGSYNANPASVNAALDTLNNLKTERKKIAVLGQMNELGEQSKQLHREIGEHVTEVADEIIGVFGDAQEFTKTAQRKNKPAKFFQTAEEAGDYLKLKLKANDLVLTKGSQNNVRLEKCIKKILANPHQAENFLCRQEKEWQ